MAEDKPGLHIDLDWKKQAQEEKKRLEEEEKKRADERAAATAAPAGPAGVAPGEAGDAASQSVTQRGARAAGRTRGARGELPPASIASLSQSLATQALYYLSDSAARAGDEMANMDMAKHLIDTLQVLEQKTQGHLDAEEQQALDTALYEARTRFMSAAGQVIAGT
jgi:hypothetical protein